MMMALISALTFASTNIWFPDTSVTFSTPATTAKALFPQLSKAFGFTLTTSPQTEGEVFLIRVKNVSAKDLMDRMANVSNTEWRKEGTSFRLVRPDSLTRKAEARDSQVRAAQLRESLGAELARIRSMPAWSPSEAERIAKESEKHAGTRRTFSNGNLPPNFVFRSMPIPARGPDSPSGRTIPVLLNDIGPERLALIAPGTRTVFALRPTSMQSPFGNNAPGIIAEYISQESAYTEAYNKLSASEGSTAPAETDNTAPVLGQALLVVTRSGDGLNTTLKTADVNGATIVQGTYSLPIAGRNTTPFTEANAITLSPAATEFAKMLDSVRGPNLTRPPGTMINPMPSRNGQTTYSYSFSSGPAASIRYNISLSKELRELILHPEQHDPQSLVPGESFTAVAASLGKNLVADIPDSAIVSMSGQVNGRKFGVDDLIDVIGPNAGLIIEQSENWLSVKPQRPAEAVTNRVNRSALGTLLRKLDSKGILSLDDLAEFTMKQSNPAGSNDVDGVYMKAINPIGAGNALVSLERPWTLRVYATMTPAQKSAVDANRPINFSDLTPAQQAWISYDLFNSFDGPRISNELIGRQIPNSRGVFDGTAIGAERTQALPESWPKTATMTLTVNRESAVLGTDSKSGGSFILNAAGIASQRFLLERPDLSPIGTTQKLDLFRPGSQTTYSFQYDFTPQLSLTRTLSDATIDGQAVAYDALPDAFKSEVDKQLEEMRKRLANMQFRTRSGTPPPQP